MTRLSIKGLFNRQNLAGISYVVIVLGLCLITLFALINIVERYRERDASLDVLARLRERPGPSAHPGIMVRAGETPFLEGPSVTLASASLLQHLSNAITKAGGSLVSTEIEPYGIQSGDYLKASATCELEQPAVQRLLYDIESGAPLLFVDQLLIQPAMDDGRMRILLAVSGMWMAAK